MSNGNGAGGEEALSSASTADVRLAIRGVSKAFLGVQALNRVSFDVGAGEVLALIGENGAGKSTIIKILAGAQGPDEGAVLIDGRGVNLSSPAEAERHGIATVYQEMSLFPDLSVAENLTFDGQKGSAIIRWRQARQEATRLLAELGLAFDVTQLVRDLSVAEKQMVEIAKALRHNARILILDEPTAVLGGDDVDKLLGLVKDLKRRGVSVIFVSHRLDEVFGLADKYVVLRDGVVTGTGSIAETSHDELVSLMVGRQWVRPERASGREVGSPLLTVSHLSRAGVLYDISFEVRAGEVLGIAGLRGAGRTELARAIFGADPITAGEVIVSGETRPPSSPIAAIRSGIGLVPEERKSAGLFTNLSTMANIPIVKTMKNRRAWVSPRHDRGTALKYKETLRIKVADVAAPVASLSGGNQQKVVLAKWLEAGVRVLILDEPTRGIDIGAKQEIYQQINKLCAAGIAVIVISSELPEVLSLSDRILVMHGGAIQAELDGPTATEEGIMYHAVGGARS